jgi:RNA methyltransferase, TrmH family
VLLLCWDAAHRARIDSPSGVPFPSSSAGKQSKHRSKGRHVLSRGEIKRLHALAHRKGRHESGRFLVEGVRVVEDLLASRVVPRTAFLAPSIEDTDRGAALARALRERVATVDVTEGELATIAGTDTPQGVVVTADVPRHTLDVIAQAGPVRGIALDGVQDPGNFGTIVRIADAFAAAFVAVLPGTVDPWNPKAVRSAAGSSLRVPIVETQLDSLLAHMRRARCVVLGADTHGRPVNELGTPDRLLLLLGNEGAGLSAAARAACDELVAIPMRGAAESLNVGVAAGILLYELTRE